jgi:hypothetical protein
MGEIRVRCIGTPVEVSGREEPTEIDLVQPCGWEGTAQIPVGERLDDHCPMCDGVVERADPKVEQATCLCGHPQHPDHDTRLPALICATCQRENRHPPRCWGWHPKVEQATTTTPDKVEQAIQAANAAIVEGVKQMHLTNAGMDIGRIAVEAAAPILLERLAEVERAARELEEAADVQLFVRFRLVAKQLEETKRAAREFLEATSSSADTISWGDYAQREARLARLVGYIVPEVERGGGT